MYQYNIISSYKKPPVFWYNESAKVIFSLKRKIDEDNNLERWEKAKKYVNLYELVYSPYDSLRNSILLKKKVLSRAYYKFLEIVIDYKIMDYFKTPIQSLHLAEGPGGFIQAWNDIREKKGIVDSLYGITLRDNRKVKGWNQNFPLFQKENVEVNYGIDGTGDLFKNTNIQYLKERFQNNAELITGDGGFDFSEDFLAQESNSLPLLFIQAYIAIHCQKKDGIFILKVFDILNVPTIQLLELIQLSYDTFFLSKPKTSRGANSEKYVVFVGFKGMDRNTSIRWNNLLRMILIFWNKRKQKQYIHRLHLGTINSKFLKKLKLLLTPIMVDQYSNMEKTIDIVEKMKKQKQINWVELREKQVEESKKWVDQYFTYLFQAEV